LLYFDLPRYKAVDIFFNEKTLRASRHRHDSTSTSSQPHVCGERARLSSPSNKTTLFHGFFGPSLFGKGWGETAARDGWLPGVGGSAALPVYDFFHKFCLDDRRRFE